MQVQFMIDKNLGFYKCKGVDFQSKIDACTYSQICKQPITWVFHNDVYDHYNWHIEPEAGLDQLYDLRARQLREQYDYLVLSYSGGADSNNILESFIRQGLHIDEIVTNHVTKATKSITVLDTTVTSAWNFGAEHELQAVPRLQYIQKHLPRTKITVLDVSDSIVDTLRKIDDPRWVLGRGDKLSVGQSFRYNYFYFAEIKRTLDQGASVAIVVGTDKPKTFIRDHDLYLSFVDRVVNIANINDYNREYTNTKVELFYWAETTAPLICKQAHVIRRWLEANPNEQEFWQERNIKTDVVRLHHERRLRDILYTNWNSDWYQADKSTSWWHSEFDTWFHSNQEFASESAAWRRGLDFVVDRVPDYVVRDQSGTPDGLQLFKNNYKIGAIGTGKH